MVNRGLVNRRGPRSLGCFGGLWHHPEMLQEVDGLSCRTHKANLAIHKLAIRPTEVSSTKDENALGDGAIFKVMAVHLDNSVF